MPKLKKLSQDKKRLADTKSRRIAREDKERRELERLVDKESHRLARADEERRELERLADKESRRVARADEERRELERLADKESRRVARADEERRELERLADKESRRVARVDEERRELERLADKESRRVARVDEERRELERLADKESRRVARVDEERRELERLANTKSRRIAREDEERRELERVADKESRRVVRDDEERRDLERLANTKLRRIAREEEERRELERVANTNGRRITRQDTNRRNIEKTVDANARRIYRLNAEKRGTEQSKDTASRRIARLNPVRHLTDFQKAIKIGPTTPCQCCDGLFFVTDMRLLHRDAILIKYNNNFCKQVLRPSTDDNQEHLCVTCHNHITNGRVPKLCFSNGFSFPSVPDELKGLTPLEERLVAGRIPFMIIQKLGVDRQCGLKGNVINVINPINQTASILPRSFNEASVIQLMLMRKMEYNNPYMFETIRPKKVYDAAQYLSKTTLYQDEGIVLSEDWLTDMPADEVKFVVDEEDKKLTTDVNTERVSEEVGGLNPGGQQTLLIDFDALENNEAIKFAPGEGQKPISLLLDSNAEALSFPTIYCGMSRVMLDDRITRTDIAKSDARNRDRRCAIPSKLLYSYKLSQTHQVANQIAVCLRKKKGCGKATAGNLLNEEFVDNLVQHDDGFKLLKQIRSSPAYWQERQKVLMAMIRQLGIPTLFITLSAAEVKWNELIVTLQSVLNGIQITEEEAEELTWETKADLIRRDPITCSRYFDHRLRQCNKHILLNKSGIFKEHPVLDFFTRIEFQHRGSPHMHGLYWLKEAPKFDEDDPDSFQLCSDFIDKYISCQSDMERIIHQSHKHTRCCEVKYKGSTKCRFGMPYPPMERTQILLPFPVELPVGVKISATNNLQAIKHQVEYLHREKVDLTYEEFLEYMGLDEHQYIMAVRSGIHRPTVFLKRKISDVFFNAYNTELAQSWQANMDIQFILDPYACCKYVAAYVSKSCRGMSELLNQVVEEVKAGHLSSKEKLKRFGHVFLNGSEVSAQEAAYTVLGIPLSICSRDSVYINTSQPSERVFITKPVKDLKALPENSTNVVIEGLLHHYSQRPRELENCSLAQFSAYWTYSKTLKEKKKKNREKDPRHDEEYCDEAINEDGEPIEPTADEEESTTYKLIDGTGFIKKRRIARVIRFRNFGRFEENEDYCRENLMLYTPWRNEVEELLEKDCIKEYSEKMEQIEKVKTEFDTRLDLSTIHNEVDQSLNEEDDQEYLVDDEFAVMHGEEFEGDFGLEIQDGEKRKAEKLKMPNMIGDEDYKTLIGKLNEKQLQYHNHVIKLLSKQPFQSYYEFVSGGAGVGKSMLITAICQTIMRKAAVIPGKDPTRMKVLLCASTGVAAFNIGGYTLHQAFGLPFNQYNGNMPRLTESTRNKYACQFADLDLIIIDEISMTSMEHLFQIDERLKQIFKTSADFGGKSITAVGDFNQMEPVMASWIFDEPKKGTAVIAGNYLWPKFKFFELTECMRQKDDVPFAEALNRLAIGMCTQDDIELFKSREIIPNKLKPPSSAIRLKYTNNDVDITNTGALAMMTTEGAVSHANDRVQGRGKKEQHEAIRNAAKNLETKKAQNLPLDINFKVGARYMMTVNSDTSDGLVNGAIGILRKIIYGNTVDGRRIPLQMMVQFPDNVGQKLKTRMTKVRQGKNGKEEWDWVPIGKETRSIVKWPGRGLEVVRSQFAFIPAEAITIHKAQGSTFKEGVVVSTQYKTKANIIRNIPRRALYVAFSRSPSLSCLFIDGEFFPPKPPDANDKVMLAIEELKKRPVIFNEDDIEFGFTNKCSPVKQRTQNFSLPINVSLNNFYKLGERFGSLISFYTLRDGGKLDDPVMNAIGHYTVSASGLQNAYYIDTLFMDNVVIFPNQLKHTNVDDAIFFIFLNPGRDHWLLAEIDFKGKRINTYDSLPSFTETYYDSLIVTLKLRLELVGIASQNLKAQKQMCCSIQQNGIDCGPMALEFLKNRCANQPMDQITPTAVKSFRKFCATKLIKSTDASRSVFNISNNDICGVFEYCQSLIYSS